MEDVKEKTLKHFNDTAHTYDTSSDGRFVSPMYQDLLDELSNYPTGRLLDVGCGNGNVLSILQNSDLELYGIDLSENMIHEARQRLQSNANLCIGDAEKLPYETNYFDLVVCNASFHHYPKPDIVLRDMHRVMKRGAKLLIGEGYAPQPFRTLLNFSFRFSQSGDFHSYGKGELIRMAGACGFTREAVKKTGKHSLLYVFSAQ